MSSVMEAESLPRLQIWTMFRLGLFQMGLGMMSVLFLGILNRAMIDNLAIPAAVAAIAIALHQFVAPARVWFGQMSDAKPIAGYHRTGYVWIGAALLGVTAFLTVQLMWRLGEVVRATGGWSWNGSSLLWTVLLGLGFALYGLTLSACSTPFAALLVDISDEEDRPRLIGVVWSMLMVGIVVGAILISVLLRQLESDTPIPELQTAIDRVFLIIPALVFGLAVVATFGIERAFSRYGSRSTMTEREDQITLGRALRVLTASRQTGIFFTFLLIMTISLFMQDAVLEPYGATVFNMPFAETTQLNAYWGTGTLLSIGSTGFLLVPRLGKKGTTQVGCLAVAISACLILLAGFTSSIPLLLASVFIFGLASGVTTTGAISLMLDLTAAETAGTFIGAWGLSQAWARAISTVLGGSVLNVGQGLFASPVLAYGLVFLVQAAGMVAAVVLVNRVDIEEFRANARRALTQVLASEID